MTQASVFCFLWIVMKSQPETKAEIDAQPHSCTRPPRKRPRRRSHPAHPPARPSSGHTRLGLSEGFGTRCQGKKHFCKTPLGLFHLEDLGISTPPVNPENILAVIISIENCEDKLGKSLDAIETISFYLYLMRRCHIASENVFISKVSEH